MKKGDEFTTIPTHWIVASIFLYLYVWNK
jgi:hypothetical protein